MYYKCKCELGSKWWWCLWPHRRQEVAIYRHSTPVVRRHVLIRDDVGDLDEGHYGNHGNIYWNWCLKWEGRLERVLAEEFVWLGSERESMGFWWHFHGSLPWQFQLWGIKGFMCGLCPHTRGHQIMNPPSWALVQFLCCYLFCLVVKCRNFKWVKSRNQHSPQKKTHKVLRLMISKNPLWGSKKPL